MSMDHINILSCAGVGSTFLDWSISYLTSPSLSKVYINKNNELRNVKIPSSPLTTNNAHNHYKTHPNISTFEIYRNQSNHILNDHPFIIYAGFNSILPYSKIVNNYLNDKFILFQHTNLDIDIIFLMQYTSVPYSEFVYSKNNYSIWDKRELLSLSYRDTISPQLCISETHNLSEKHNVYIINFREYISSFNDQMLSFMCDTLKLSIISNRIEEWNKVYNNWSKKFNITFFDDIDTIINCIINNINYDLSPYNLTFAHEVIICNKLFTDYNLILKMYGLSQMPSNTKQWHSLLEENNIHYPASNS